MKAIGRFSTAASHLNELATVSTNGVTCANAKRIKKPIAKIESKGRMKRLIERSSERLPSAVAVIAAIGVPSFSLNL
jgi:hypothetical protein